MMHFIEKLFKKEPVVDYTIADYTPAKPVRNKSKTQISSPAKSREIVGDEMEIDRLYQQK